MITHCAPWRSHFTFMSGDEIVNTLTSVQCIKMQTALGEKWYGKHWLQWGRWAVWIRRGGCCSHPGERGWGAELDGKNRNRKMDEFYDLKGCGLWGSRRDDVPLSHLVSSWFVVLYTKTENALLRVLLDWRPLRELTLGLGCLCFLCPITRAWQMSCTYW